MTENPKEPPEGTPLPQALFSCKFCREDFSFPAGDLNWYEQENDWVCDSCSEYFFNKNTDETFSKPPQPGINLRDYILKVRPSLETLIGKKP